MQNCIEVTNSSDAACANCGAVRPQMHKAGALFRRRVYCRACCPACHPGPARLVPAKPQAKPMAQGSQWLDLGYGRPADPFYSDRERREELARTRGDQSWVPRRNWFGR
jgi:hypothetical protein